MQFKSLGAVLLGGVAIVAAAPAEAGWNFHFDHVLGTSLDIVAVTADQKLAALAADVARAEIARLDAILSGWRSDSELQKLNAVPQMAVSRDLFNVIAQSESWRARTGGAFSARLGLLEQTGDASLAPGIDQAEVGLDAGSLTVTRPQNVRFAVDGIAKGYVIDRALEAARNLPGVKGLMVDIGGDLRCWGQSPSAGGWRIGVVDACNGADNAAPAAVLTLDNKAVATSGRGARMQTIFDPKNGVAQRNTVMATAVANCAADADALASAFAVMKPADSLKLADSLPGVATHIVDADGVTYVSRDWNGVQLAQNTPQKPAAVAAAGAWPPGFAVNIEYESLPPFGGFRARNPYVVVYITNEAGNLVRTLMYSADKYRYMRENYVFWNKFGENANLDSVVRPTRPAGHYTLQWDGKDNNGRAVPQGKYTINVEAAREHGFHSIQRIELNLGTAAAAGTAAAIEDMGVAKASYGPKS